MSAPAPYLTRRRTEARAFGFAGIAELCAYRCRIKRALRRLGVAFDVDAPLQKLIAQAEQAGATIHDKPTPRS